VAHFKHPFIEHFFLGERGQRAMAPVQSVEHALAAQTAAAVPTPDKEPS
jgi:phospholipid/cholesterol/gamma-HCH transport system ATP-binding protein